VDWYLCFAGCPILVLYNRASCASWGNRLRLHQSWSFSQDADSQYYSLFPCRNLFFTFIIPNRKGIFQEGYRHPNKSMSEPCSNRVNSNGSVFEFQCCVGNHERQDADDDATYWGDDVFD
jgi:hypothetical protein